LSTFARQDIAGPRTREPRRPDCSRPASGDGFAKKGDRCDTRMFRGYRPCGDSPRLRMPLGAAASEEVHLNLASRWFCRPGLEGKVPDRFPFSMNR
jgi:hypothetical protein